MHLKKIKKKETPSGHDRSVRHLSLNPLPSQGAETFHVRTLPSRHVKTDGGELKEAVRYHQLGLTLYQQGKIEEAVVCCRKALELKPDSIETYNNMGLALGLQGKSEEAVACYHKALELRPDCDELYRNLVLELQKTCAWQKLESPSATLDELTKTALENGTKTAEMPFMNLSRHADPSYNFAVAKSWSRDIAKSVSHLNIRFSFEDRRSSKTKITVGYLSNDFRNHPTSHIILGLFGLHNRDKFKVFCYSYGHDDGSHYRKQIQQDCDRFVDIRNLNSADAAKRIYEDQVDILVDLMGHITNSRLDICTLRLPLFRSCTSDFPARPGLIFLIISSQTEL